MNIRLNKILIENFKGIKQLETAIGEQTLIRAENGVGKTTVYDALLWLFFGKDSTDRKDFEITPLDKNNQSVRGLVTRVVGYFCFDDTTHTFRKEQHEKVVKDQLRGYETLCWIDDVPKKVSDYLDYIVNIIPQDTFKILTNLHHFPEGIHHTARREILLNIAGEIGTPEGFDGLLDKLNGRSVADYKKVLAGQKEGYENEREDINPRTDEIQKGLPQYAGDADTYKINLFNKRTELTEALAALKKNRTDLSTKETTRQRKIDKVNELKGKKAEREAVLKNDTSAVADLLTEKAKLNAFVAEKKQAVVDAQTAVSLRKSAITGSVKVQLDRQTSLIKEIQAEYKTASEATDKTTCFNCKQQLPEDMLNAEATKRATRLAEIAKRGETALGRVNALTAEKETLEAGLGALQTNLKDAQADLDNAEECRRVRTAQIDKAVADNVTPAPDTDEIWLKIVADIAEYEAAIGEPVSKQLEAIEAQQTAKTTELSEVNTALAQSDRAVQDKKRIEELSAREKQLGVLIAGIEKEIAGIGKYEATQSQLVEEAVNGKFKYAHFKLFNQLLNGGYEPCCEVLLNGVPYPDMSTGQQIYVGIDIVNVLSAHYGMSVPLFIDHAESLTFDIEAETQTILLFAEKGIRTLEVVNLSDKASVVKPKTEEGEQKNGESTTRTRGKQSTRKVAGKTR